MPKNRNPRVLLAVVLVALAGLGLFLLSGEFRLLSTGGYPTAYEGAKATYFGIYYNGAKYTNSEKHSASLLRFDTQLKFDPDDYYAWQCNLAGEMTSVFIPNTQNLPPTWVPQDWWRPTLDWQNPRNVYEWKIVGEDGYVHFYRMEEWLTVWYLSLSAEWDSGPDFWSWSDEAENRRYLNTEVWFEFDVTPTWYFQGAEKVYFAVAKVELAHVDVTAKDMAGNKYGANPSMSFIPESVGSILYLYLVPFEFDKAPNPDELKQYYYQNTTLNPLYFRDKVYAYITLADFGTQEWWEGLALKAKGDVVTLGFKVVQFVVGEWKVKDVGELPDDYGRSSKYGVWGWTGLGDFWNAVATWLSNPFNLVGLGIFAVTVIAVVVVIALFWFVGLPAGLTKRGKTHAYFSIGVKHR